MCVRSVARVVRGPQKPDARADARLIHTIRTVGGRSRNIIRKGQVRDLKKPKVGGLILEIDGDRAVFPCRFDGLSHVSSPVKSRWVRMRHRENNVLKWQASCERIGASPLNPLECGPQTLVFSLVSFYHRGAKELSCTRM